MILWPLIQQQDLELDKWWITESEKLTDFKPKENYNFSLILGDVEIQHFSLWRALPLYTVFQIILIQIKNSNISWAYMKTSWPVNQILEAQILPHMWKCT